MEKNTAPWTPIGGCCKTLRRNISQHLPEYTMSYPIRPRPIKPQTLRRSAEITCARYYVSDFASGQDRRRSIYSKADGVRCRPLDPWRDVSKFDVHSVRRGELADRVCSSSLRTPYHISVNKAIYNQFTVIFFLFTELVCLEVVLTQITDPYTPGSSHMQIGQ